MKPEILTQIQHAKRLIGIVPRVKRKANMEASPTTVSLWDTENETGPVYRPVISIEDEQGELDFVLGIFPLKMRAVVEGEDLTAFRDYHIERDKEGTPKKVPALYEGLKARDVVVLSHGGMGDNLAFALSRRAEAIGAMVLRCRPSELMEFREAGNLDRKDDSTTLVELLKKSSQAFYPVLVREREITYMRECLRVRTDAQKARIACAQRLHQRFLGQIFCNPEGLFPEGAIEKAFDEVRANDPILTSLECEEMAADKALAKACEALPVYRELFKPIEGIGPRIASGLIAVIQCIQRFDDKWKLRKFCGAHCTVDGKFPRRRSGQRSDFNPSARQCLYLLGDQFNRRPETVWGKKLKENKAFYRDKHPVQIIADKELSELWRSIDSFFRRYNVVVSPEGFKVETIDGLYAFFSAGKAGLRDLNENPDDEVTQKLAGFEEVIRNAGTPKGNMVTLFTPAHIHRMGIQKTLGDFVEWLFEAWWALEGEQESQISQEV